MSKNIYIIAIIILVASCGRSVENKNLNFPNELIGVETTYKYSGGNKYTVKFEDEGLSYQYRSGKSPEKWWGKFKYNHMLTENNEHLVSWFETDYGDYVTLLLNFESNVLYGSAIIKGKIVHFQKGKIESVKG